MFLVDSSSSMDFIFAANLLNHGILCALLSFLVKWYHLSLHDTVGDNGAIGDRIKFRQIRLIVPLSH